MMSRRNKPRQVGTELLAAAKADETIQPTSIEMLRRTLQRYSALAEAAWQARNAAAFRVWSAAAERIAIALLPHEQPRLSPVAPAPAVSDRPVRFPLAIFDSQRRPVNLELTANPMPVTAPEGNSADVDVIDAVAEAAKPPNLESPAMPQPEARSPDEAASDDALAWRRSQQWRAYFGTGRQPCGSRHRW
jgi:hypothetical protein